MTMAPSDRNFRTENDYKLPGKRKADACSTRVFHPSSHFLPRSNYPTCRPLCRIPGLWHGVLEGPPLTPLIHSLGMFNFVSTHCGLQDRASLENCGPGIRTSTKSCWCRSLAQTLPVCFVIDRNCLVQSNSTKAIFLRWLWQTTTEL
jgi:hypothetical protein